MESKNFTTHNVLREINEKTRLRFCRRFHLTETMIKRLGVIHELEGHTGCVNCLQWNETGDVLASGSDDCHIILWNPYTKKTIKRLQSGHQGNIFSVKFLETTSRNNIISGAADCRIRLHDIITSETILDCSCHFNRVKRLAVAPYTPFMFWSAGEDGLVLQFDTRLKHRCVSIRNNVLINLNSCFAKAEAKCIAINPLRPELLAVGANDAYVRLYDRRMITTTTCTPSSIESIPGRWMSSSDSLEESMSPDDDSSSSSIRPPPSNLSDKCVQYFFPTHLSIKRKKYRPLACTYIAFSPQGDELLANIGGEQVYLFDINHPIKPIKLYSVSESNGVCKDVTLSNGFCANGTNGFSSVYKHQNLIHKVFGLKQNLPPKVNELKNSGNDLFEIKDYNGAVELYNKALLYCPNAAVLHGNRAQALMNRGWDGDTYAALRDCYKALQIDSEYFRAHFRLARCLYELQRYKEASECYEQFKLKFPDAARSQSCLSLEKQIYEIMQISNKESDGSSSKPAEGQKSEESERKKEDQDSKNSRKKKLNISEQEQIWRSLAFDFKQRFCGHCNTTTDIKEANFFGNDGQYIVAGSDDGNIFVWDRRTTNIVRVLRGDESIVNCLQPHPYDCLLATSGIESVIRLWLPKHEDSEAEKREVRDAGRAASANQQRMHENPVELALVNMGYRLAGQSDTENSNSSEGILQCRPS